MDFEGVCVHIDLVQDLSWAEAAGVYHALKTWAADESCVKDVAVYQSGRIVVLVNGDYKEALEELKELISSEYEIANIFC